MPTIAPFGSVLLAMPIFGVLLIAPGYVAGWLGNVLEFRDGTIIRRLALSVPLSFAIVPMLMYLPWRLVSVNAMLAVFGITILGFVAIVVREIGSGAASRPGGRRYWIVGTMASGIWLVIAMASLPDMVLHGTNGPQRYFSTTAYDYASRVPMINEISLEHQLPAHTPFLHPGKRMPLRYHYFWPMVCAAVEIAGRGALCARDTAIAGAVWCGIGWMCCIALYLRIFQEERSAKTHAIALALLGITGLDILPVLYHTYTSLEIPGRIYPTIEWWNEQVTGWLDGMLWVPHNLASLSAAMIAFLIVWKWVEDGSDLRTRPLPIVVAAIALASSAGLSIYVTFTAACCLIVWALLLLRRGDSKGVVAVAVVGTLSLLLLAPFIAEVRSVIASSDASDVSTAPIEFHIREFWLLRDQLKPLQLADGPGLTPIAAFFRLVCLPLNYFLELGVYFYAGLLFCIWLWEKRPISRRDLAAVSMLATSVIIATFLSSHAGNTANDLGWRSFMPAQFILLLWTAKLLADTSGLLRRQRALLLVLLLFGMSSTLWDLMLLRTYLPFLDSQLFNRMADLPPQDRQMGERIAAQAQTYTWIRTHTPRETVIQNSPEKSTYLYGLFADRFGLAVGHECDGFSGHGSLCRQISMQLLPLFIAPTTTKDFQDACRAFPMDLVIVEDTDAAWILAKSWVRDAKPVYSTPFTKVFECHPIPGVAQ